uniref:Uncharacterized protein n=1 Tax=viral metagenome TaxID=1070528 RepID=A0A6C0AJE0_9ZZZZ
MSSTSNLQSLLTYILRPSYTYSNGAFTTVMNLSNINRLTANTVTYQVLYIGDSSNNVYVGSNSGNSTVYATACNASCNSTLGLLAATGLSNSTLSEFVGYYTGGSASNVVNSVLVGGYAGYGGSNISNSILIGTSNSASGLTSISNTISIGGNAGGTGTSNLYLGTTTGSNMTGSGNIFVGHGISLANIPSYTYAASQSGGGIVTATCNYTASSSSNLFIGLGASNMLISGNLSNGLLSIGTTDTSSYALDGFGQINTPAWGGTITGVGQYATSGYGFLALDVSGWTRIRSGLVIATDPYNPGGINAASSNAKYELDVNGHLRIQDGYGALTYSNSYGGVSSNTQLLLSNVGGGSTTVNIGAGGAGGALNVSGPVTAGVVQMTGCYTVRGTVTSGSAANNTLNLYTITSPGYFQVTVIDTKTANFYITSSFTATILPANLSSSVFQVFSNSSGGNLTLNIASSVIILTDVTGGSRVLSYNITAFPTS